MNGSPFLDRLLPRHPIVSVALSLALLIGLPRDQGAQGVSCDLEPIAGPYGYQLRGDRCEGLYVRKVHGTPLSLVSLTAFFEDFDASAGASLLVQWSAPNHDAVRLEVEGTRRKLYYRMESRRPPGTASYLWPSDVLAALKIGHDHLGILGWTRSRLGEVERDVLVPLHVTQQGAAPPCGTYQLVLFPGAKLEEVYVSLASLRTDGEPKRWLRKQKPLLYGYYPAERAITVPLAELAAGGYYELEVSATLASGGSSTLDGHWIYQAGGLAACSSE